MATPKPWPEGTIPTSTQLTDWFLEQPHDEQVALMSMMLNDARVAAACWQQDHGGILVTLDQLEARIAELQSRDLVVEWRNRANRYRAAWLSAARYRHVVRGIVAERLDAQRAEGEGALFAVDADTEVALATTYSDYLGDPDIDPALIVMARDSNRPHAERVEALEEIQRIQRRRQRQLDRAEDQT